MKKKIISVILIGCLLFSLSFFPLRAIDIDVGKVFKVFGIGYLVTVIAKPLNDFINQITLNKNLATTEATKVVPIVSLGSGAYIGAAQVAGPENRVNEARAVAQLEVDWKDEVRVKILIPIDNVNPLKGVRRVKGVGVSAVIDIKI